MMFSFSRTMAHETEVHKLYEEMETQIKSERERILLEVCCSILLTLGINEQV